jgi:hypothetical protein
MSTQGRPRTAPVHEEVSHAHSGIPTRHHISTNSTNDDLRSQRHNVQNNSTASEVNNSDANQSQQPQEESKTTRPQGDRKGRHDGSDRHPNIWVSQVLLFPSRRPGRLITRKTGDKDAHSKYGDDILHKDPGSTRFLFQNVKGLTHSPACDDYRYFLSAMLSYSVDVYGMAETNTGWQLPHLQADFKSCVKRQFTYGKAVFGAPSRDIDSLQGSETFQAGETLQVARGNITTTISENQSKTQQD